MLREITDPYPATDWRSRPSRAANPPPGIRPTQPVACRKEDFQSAHELALGRLRDRMHESHQLGHDHFRRWPVLTCKHAALRVRWRSPSASAASGSPGKVRSLPLYEPPYQSQHEQIHCRGDAATTQQSGGGPLCGRAAVRNFLEDFRFDRSLTSDSPDPRVHRVQRRNQRR